MCSKSLKNNLKPKYRNISEFEIFCRNIRFSPTELLNSKFHITSPEARLLIYFSVKNRIFIAKKSYFVVFSRVGILPCPGKIAQKSSRFPFSFYRLFRLFFPGQIGNFQYVFSACF